MFTEFVTACAYRQQLARIRCSSYINNRFKTGGLNNFSSLILIFGGWRDLHDRDSGVTRDRPLVSYFERKTRRQKIDAFRFRLFFRQTQNENRRGNKGIHRVINSCVCWCLAAVFCVLHVCLYGCHFFFRFAHE